MERFSSGTVFECARGHEQYRTFEARTKDERGAATHMRTKATRDKTANSMAGNSFGFRQKYDKISGEVNIEKIELKEKFKAFTLEAYGREATDGEIIENGLDLLFAEGNFRSYLEKQQSSANGSVTGGKSESESR